MKILKPDAASLLSRTLRMAEQFYWGATVLLGFDLSPPAALWDEARLWETVGVALGEDQILDAAIPKPTAEALLVGACYPPDGKPARAAAVRLAIGGIDKSALVFGDRYWTHELTGYTATAPEPFTRMPLDWSRAFGGPVFARNPLGRGAPDSAKPDGRPLPNVEDPNKPVASPEDRPEPMGFGPLPSAWPQRSQLAGSYDEEWRKEQWPFYAKDIDFHYFNTAPADQRLSGWPQGDEAFHLEGAHPSGRALRGVLPGYKARVFVTRGRSGSEDFSEIPMHADTIWFFPDHNLGVVAFRGAFHVNDEEATEIDHVYIALERLNEPKFLPYHYQDFMNSIKPPADPAPPPEPETKPTEKSEPQAAPSPKPEPNEELRAAEENMRKAEVLLLAELAKLGLKPPPKTEPEPELEPKPELTPEELDAQLQAAEEQLARALAEAGVDPEADAAAQIMTPEQALGDEFDPLAVIAGLKAEGLLTPELEREVLALGEEWKKCKALDAEMREQSAQAPPEPESERRWDRTALLHAWSEGRRDFAGQDFTGADLSHLDLSEGLFRRAVLRAALLSNAALDKADFSEADLSEADMSHCSAANAVFSQANLTQANLGGALFAGARWENTDLSGVSGQNADCNGGFFAGAVFLGAEFSAASFAEADFQAAICTGAIFTDAVFHAATLQRADFRKAVLVRADLSKTSAQGCEFSEADLCAANCREADFSAAFLDGAQLRNTDFSHATLAAACLFAAKGESAIFREANAYNLRADAATALPAADFSGARLELAYLGGADLIGAVFDHARLDGATFKKCRLASASLHRAHARGARFLGCDLSDARFVGTDLLHGSLAGAQCRRTDFSGANLFGVDTLRALFETCVVEHANLGRTRLMEAR